MLKNAHRELTAGHLGVDMTSIKGFNGESSYRVSMGRRRLRPDRVPAKQRRRPGLVHSLDRDATIASGPRMCYWRKIYEKIKYLEIEKGMDMR